MFLFTMVCALGKKGWIPLSWCGALRPRDPSMLEEKGFENAEPDESSTFPSGLDDLERELMGM